MDNEKRQMSEREYYAFRELYGIYNAFSDRSEELKKRLKDVKGGWRDVKLIESKAFKLLVAILNTVPEKKLKQMKCELEHAETLVVINKPKAVETSDLDDNITYVSQRALERIAIKAIETNCVFCDKKGADAKHCQLRKDIVSTYMFDVDNCSKKECPFSGYVI